MSEYYSTVTWERKGQVFTDNEYSRAHLWSFDGGANIQASSSPNIVPSPYSIEENVDPEEAFVASLSSCHMLFFLSIAAKKKFIVERYLDHAEGLMEKDSKNKMSMTRITLKPNITFSGTPPTRNQLEKMHDLSHDSCFIANSVKSEIIIEIVND